MPEYEGSGSISVHGEFELWKEVLWTDLLNSEISRSNVWKNANFGTWSGQIRGNREFDSGNTGHFQFEISNLHYCFVGLSADWPVTNANLDFGIFLNFNWQASIYENNSLVHTIGAYTYHDVFKIEHSGSTVKYYLNDTLEYTSLQTPSYPLFPCGRGWYTSRPLINCEWLIWAGPSPETMTIKWIDGVDHRGSVRSLVRAGQGVNGWSSSLCHDYDLTVNADDYAEVVWPVQRTALNGALVGIGDTTGTASSGVHHAWQYDGSTLNIREFWTVQWTGTLAEDDILKIVVDNGTVKYYQNDILRYTSLDVMEHNESFHVVGHIYYANYGSLESVFTKGFHERRFNYVMDGDIEVTGEFESDTLPTFVTEGSGQIDVFGTADQELLFERTMSGDIEVFGAADIESFGYLFIQDAEGAVSVYGEFDILALAYWFEDTTTPYTIQVYGEFDIERIAMAMPLPWTNQVVNEETPDQDVDIRADSRIDKVEADLTPRVADVDNPLT